MVFSCLFILNCGNKKVRISYDKGSIMEEYEVDNEGKKEGTYKSYYESGKIRELSTYKGDLLVGTRYLYFENGNVEIEEKYADGGILNGEQKVFYKDGQVQIVKNYENNELTGLLKVYYPSGKIKEEVTMRHNNENGPFTEYFENGQVQWKGTYLNGENEFGLLEEWDSLGAPIKKMLCDSFAICRTFWHQDSTKINPYFKEHPYKP